MTDEKGNGVNRLRDLVRASVWMMRVLATVRSVHLPDAWVGAGVVRDLVWGQLYGAGFNPQLVRDVDVAFFDPHGLGRGRDADATRRLRDTWPEVPWEATNQASVHTWYAAEFDGDPANPLRTISEAVATWPETATAVALRLGPADEIDVCAPLGLADLPDSVGRRDRQHHRHPPGSTLRERPVAAGWHSVLRRWLSGMRLPLAPYATADGRVGRLPI